MGISFKIDLFKKMWVYHTYKIRFHDCAMWNPWWRILELVLQSYHIDLCWFEFHWSQSVSGDHHTLYILYSIREIHNPKSCKSWGTGFGLFKSCSNVLVQVLFKFCSNPIVQVLFKFCQFFEHVHKRFLNCSRQVQHWRKYPNISNFF